MSKILNVETRLEPLRVRPVPIQPSSLSEEAQAKLGRLTTELAEVHRVLGQLHRKLDERMPPPAPSRDERLVQRWLLVMAWILAVAVWVTDPSGPPPGAQRIARFLDTLPLSGDLSALPVDATPQPQAAAADPIETASASWQVLEMPAQREISPRLDGSSVSPEPSPESTEPAPATSDSPQELDASPRGPITL